MAKNIQRPFNGKEANKMEGLQGFERDLVMKSQNIGGH
jgi:hypothetical protein